jgi:hypothetical protein
MQPLLAVPLGRPLPTLQILATSPSGRWVWLSQIGRVTGLSYSHSYPGGPMAADWSLDVPPSAQIPALVQGSTVQIWRGTVMVWAGKVATLERGAPWRITADGIGSAAVHEPVPTTGTLDSIVDAAITAGLPWTRPASLSTKSWTGDAGAQDVGSTMLDQVLTDVLLQEGERWTVTPGGVVSAVTDPTTPTLLVRADTAPPMTLAKYASEVRVKYQSSTGNYSTRRLVNAAAAARFGRVVATLDVSYSTMTSSAADTLGNAWLARHAPSMTLSGDLTVTRGQVVTGTGGAVDLPLARPGVMARIAVLPLIRDAMLVPSAAIDLIIGQTTYHADDGTLSLAAVDRAPSPGEVILGAAA